MIGIGKPQALRSGQVLPRLSTRTEICDLAVGIARRAGRFGGALIGVAARRHGYSWLVSSSTDVGPTDLEYPHPAAPSNRRSWLLGCAVPKAWAGYGMSGETIDALSGLIGLGGAVVTGTLWDNPSVAALFRLRATFGPHGRHAMPRSAFG